VEHDGEEVEQAVMVEVEFALVTALEEESLAQEAQCDSIKAGIYIIFVSGAAPSNIVCEHSLTHNDTAPEKRNSTNNSIVY
jgi:hypothetical protein